MYIIIIGRVETGRTTLYFITAMKRQSQISIFASIVLHLFVLLISVWIKLSSGIKEEDNIPVTLVSGQKTAFPLRPFPIRRITLFNRPVSSQLPGQEFFRSEYRPSVEFHISEPKGEFIPIESIDNLSQATGIRRASFKFQERLFIPTAVEIRKEPFQRGQKAQPHPFKGYELLKDTMRTRMVEPSKNAISDALGRFASAVRERIESKKRYPTIAKDAGIEGRTGIRMVILKDGQLERVEIMVSSGHEILDRAALQSVRDAAPFPPIPKEIERDRVEMNIYLVFKLS